MEALELGMKGDGSGGSGRESYVGGVEGLFEASEAVPPKAGGGSLTSADHASAPLAVRMRPRTLDELVGQEQLRAAGSPLRQLGSCRRSRPASEPWSQPGP